ncbi:MAG: hypothetical protein RBT82_04970, partial [Desulfomonilia bacterium]|nr:hypothetical protein [Desulfomonilia bacterium]
MPGIFRDLIEPGVQPVVRIRDIGCGQFEEQLGQQPQRPQPFPAPWQALGDLSVICGVGLCCLSGSEAEYDACQGGRAYDDEGDAHARFFLSIMTSLMKPLKPSTMP